jgi:hypothetical protein
VKSELASEGFTDGCRNSAREQEDAHNQTPHIFGPKGTTGYQLKGGSLIATTLTLW